MKDNTIQKLIKLLKENARLSEEKLAGTLGVAAGEVRDSIAGLEREGVIKGYSAVIDEEKLDPNVVYAVIELKITPGRGVGFDELARTISNYAEVEAVTLMSGAYDLSVMVRGENNRQIGMFVSEQLAPIDGVLSTATHFILKRYKEKGFKLAAEETDERVESF